MKTLDDLKQFYDTALMPDLRVLEQQRRGIVRKITIVMIVALGLGGVGFLLMMSSLRQIGPAVIIPVILCLIIGGVVCIHR